jgi:hypothetical protein
LLSLFGSTASIRLLPFHQGLQTAGWNDVTEQPALSHTGEPIWLTCMGKEIIAKPSEIAG